MNKLEKVILDQHSRVRAAGEYPLEALEEAKGEILSIASQENVAEILRRTGLVTTHKDEPTSTNARSRRAQHRGYLVAIANRSLEQLKSLEAQPGILLRNQGYIGGIALEHGIAIGVFGFAPRINRLFEEEDPIQEAMGETFYPPMMWAKALRAEAYLNRGEAMRKLNMSQYLAKSSLSLGSNNIGRDTLLGATGFMPGEVTANAANAPWPIGEHIVSEEIEAFRLSGFCDQSVVDQEFKLNPTNSMFQVIHNGGSLN